jgi:transcriptional regulator with XRE-family HTH domain
MHHASRVAAADVMRELRQRGFTQVELARRAGVARETLSRWESGVQRPSIEDLERVVAANGGVLELQIIPAEHELVATIDDEYQLGPSERLRGLLGRRWPACRAALTAAAQTGERAVLVGPVAAALRRAPQRPGSGRVDLVVAPRYRDALADALLGLGAWPDGFEQAGRERREGWRAGSGALTVRDMATGINDLDGLLARAGGVALNETGGPGTVRVATVEDLLAIAQHSPWSEDALYKAGLRAVLASSHYRAARPPRSLAL